VKIFRHFWIKSWGWEMSNPYAYLYGLIKKLIPNNGLVESPSNFSLQNPNPNPNPNPTLYCHPNSIFAVWSSQTLTQKHTHEGLQTSSSLDFFPFFLTVKSQIPNSFYIARPKAKILGINSTPLDLTLVDTIESLKEKDISQNLI
jgi:hypothetical protein